MFVRGGRKIETLPIGFQKVRLFVKEKSTENLCHFGFLSFLGDFGKLIKLRIPSSIESVLLRSCCNG